jgi:penicillin-insensitive murein endopeptidase
MTGVRSEVVVRPRGALASLALALVWFACSSASERMAEADTPGAARHAAPSMRTSAPALAASTTVVSKDAPGPAGALREAEAPQPAPVDETAALLALDGSRSTSAGAPADGKLLGGVALPKRGPGFLHNPKRPHDARYGTVELVQAIVKAAAAVTRELPGIPLVVNDISLPEGGPIAQHGSHQSGRDADILFYVLDRDGAPLQSVGVPLDPEGAGWDFKELSVPEDDIAVRLDAPRTWRFMQGLLEAGGDHVQRIFIVEHLRTQLLVEAERAGAPLALRARFADVTCQPGTPHDDHMHVRFFCSPEDIARGCYDKPPIYPWHVEALAALGLASVLEPKKSRAERDAEIAERTTTRAQARKRAGPMHANVRRFLAQRETWAKQPRPGREYCR